MSARVVCDASVLAALLLDSGPDGEWATAALSGTDLAAPALVELETANVIRRLELAEVISGDQAAQGHRDLLDLAVEIWPYDLIAARAWELRRNLSIYDAGCVALAELLQTSLVTLDRRLARAPDVQCPVTTP